MAINFFVISIIPITFLVVLPTCVVPYETILVDKLPSYRRIELPASAIGPESLAFDTANGGPYVGASDGRVLKWNGHAQGWTSFAVPPRHRGVGSEECDGNSKTSMEAKCGRPLGLQFHRATGDLYICDAYYGLMVVGRNGGVATRLTRQAEGVAIRFTNGIDINEKTGMVYFTDTSTKFQRSDWVWSVATNDATGRLLSYNPRTKEVKVLIRNLEFANGVSLSKDGRFVLICETTKLRVLRYWLEGRRPSKAGKLEVFANLTTFPDNVKRNPQGEFWVGVNSGRGTIHMVKEGGGGGSMSVVDERESERIGIKYGEGGEVLEVLYQSDLMNSVSEVVENKGALWIGSGVAPFVSMFN